MKRAVHALPIVALGALLVGCGAAPRLDAKYWTDRGDKASASDPGRALANYEEAALLDEHSGDDASRLTLEAKKGEAAARWLSAEIKRFELRGDVAPAETLGFAAAVRKEAASRHVEGSVVPALRELERRAYERSWATRKGELEARSKSELEIVIELVAIRDALPPEQDALRREVDAELAARQAALMARYLNAIGGASGAEGATFLRTRLFHVARTVPHTQRLALPASLERAGRIGWQAEASGCDGIERSASAANLPSDGAHQGVLRLTATCDSSESSREVEEEETVYETKTEYYEESEQHCSSNYERVWKCVTQDSNGRCVQSDYVGESTQRCEDRPVTRERQVEVPRTVTRTVTERVLSARVTGTLSVTVDGVEQTFPVSLPETFTERGNSGKSPSSLLRELIASKVPEELAHQASQAQRRVALSHMAAAQTSLSGGNEVGAENELALAVGGGAGPKDVPADFARLAARDGLPFEAWSVVMATGEQPFSPKVAFEVAEVSLTQPSPDAEGLKARQTQRDADAAAANALVELSIADQFRAGSGVGLTNWRAEEGDSSTGVAAQMDFRGAFGENLPFFFQDSMLAFEATSSMDLGVDGLARFGLGGRTRWVWLAPYVVGGVSGRGTSGSSLYVPLGLDLGYGAKLTLRVGEEKYFELLGERLLRPREEATEGLAPVLQRLRYEIRFVVHDHGGDHIGLSGACSFFETTKDDLFTPEVGVVGRACDAKFFWSL